VQWICSKLSKYSQCPSDWVFLMVPIQEQEKDQAIICLI
jgi:hypothetical protein